MRSIRTNLFLATGLVITSFVVAAVFGVTRMLEKSSRDRISALLRTGLTGSERFLDMRTRLLARETESIAEAPYLKSTLELEGLDHATALDQARGLRELLGVHAVLLGDPDGRLRADSSKTAPPSGRIPADGISERYGELYGPRAHRS